MRDLLIRYLLGELDDAEQRQLEARLQQSPELRRELAHLRTCFVEGGEADPAAASEPPPGLAQRTTQQVNSLSDDSLPPARPMFSAVEPPAAPVSWSLADISVAAGVFLAVSMLLLPALRGSRDTSRRHICADNMRNIGCYLVSYADDHNGYVPRVRTRDCAGIFAIRLVDDGYVPANELRHLLVCPASQQRDIYATARIVITIPTGDMLQSKPAAEVERLVRLIPISYAYRLGYVDDNKYHFFRKRSRSCEPILADAPRFDAFGPRIANHNGCGLNVLNADCSVKFQTCLTVAGLSDLLYLNYLNEAAAGQGPDDVVLAVSDATPRVEVVEATSD